MVVQQALGQPRLGHPVAMVEGLLSPSALSRRRVGRLRLQFGTVASSEGVRRAAESLESAITTPT
jgi:hypothetical protein